MLWIPFSEVPGNRAYVNHAIARALRHVKGRETVGNHAQALRKGLVIGRSACQATCLQCERQG